MTDQELTLAQRMFGRPEGAQDAAPDDALVPDTAKDDAPEERSVASRMFAKQEPVDSNDTEDAEGTDDPGDETPGDVDDEQSGFRRRYQLQVEGTEVDPRMNDTILDAAHEAGMSQDATEKFVENIAPRLIAEHQAQARARFNEWTEATKSDAEIGGARLDESIGVAKRTLDAVKVSPEFRQFIFDSGLGNHPDFVRLLVRAGKRMGV